MASWGKQVASGFKLVIQCFLSIVLASVFIFDAAADTNTDTDGIRIQMQIQVYSQIPM